MYPIPDCMFALQLLSKGIPSHSKCFLIAARGAMIMKHFLLQMSKGYCVEKLDKAKFGHKVFLTPQNIQILWEQTEGLLLRVGEKPSRMFSRCQN